VIAARILTIYYFLHFLVIMPLLGLFETPRPRPASIAEAVFGPGSSPGRGGSAQPVGSAAAPETRG
jgi:ubiquinol-cytochrome c reductase cytochrome b subunit